MTFTEFNLLSKLHLVTNYEEREDDFDQNSNITNLD